MAGSQALWIVTPPPNYMDKSDISKEDENVEILARYAVSMHLEARKRIGEIGWSIFGASLVIAGFSSSYWPLPIAIVLCVAVYFYLFKSCARFVKRNTGMREDVQIGFLERYKTDVQFAKHVDQFRERGAHFSRHLD